MCCYTKIPSNNDVRNDNVIVATKSFDHDRVASMSCLQEVVHKIQHMHEKTYENVYVWTDGMWSQFRSRYLFKLLSNTALPGKTLSWYYNERYHDKKSMDRIGETVKNVIFENAKSVNWWYILHLNFLRL